MTKYGSIFGDDYQPGLLGVEPPPRWRFEDPSTAPMPQGSLITANEDREVWAELDAKGDVTYVPPLGTKLWFLVSDIGSYRVVYEEPSGKLHPTITELEALVRADEAAQGVKPKGPPIMIPEERITGTLEKLLWIVPVAMGAYLIYEMAKSSRAKNTPVTV